MKTPPDLKLVEDALRAAAHKAVHGARDERAGKFLAPPVKALAATVEAAPRAVRRRAPTAD